MNFLKKPIITAIFLSLSAVFMSACGGSAGTTEEVGQVYDTQLHSVAEAVDAYHSDTGVYPIKNFDQKTPKYLQYVIDFKKLVPGYMAESPSNTFSNGGTLEYTLLDPEHQPEVKVIDLLSLSKVQEVQQKINRYYTNHGFAPMAGIADKRGYYKINFKALGYKDPVTVKSPYSGEKLELLLYKSGDVKINYMPDIYKKWEKNKEKIKPGEDLRPLLTLSSPYAPVYSIPVTEKNGSLDFLIKDE